MWNWDPRISEKRDGLLAVACPKDADSILGRSIYQGDNMWPGVEGAGRGPHLWM